MKSTCETLISLNSRSISDALESVNYKQVKKSHNSTFPRQFAKDGDDFKSQLIIRLTLHIFGLFCAVPLKGIQINFEIANNIARQDCNI